MLSIFFVPFGEKTISVEYFLDQLIFRTASRGVKFWLIGILWKQYKFLDISYNPALMHESVRLNHSDSLHHLHKRQLICT